MKPGNQQQGQYKIPSIHPGSVDGFSCQALEPDPEDDESDYELVPDSAMGPLR
jgi:hypothetical protein